MTTCKSYLDFEPTEHPAWRSRLAENERLKIPNISEMISDILTYKEKYLIAYRNVGREEKNNADRELLIKFLLNVQEGKQIGMRDAGKTEVINYKDASKLDANVSGIKRPDFLDSGSSQDPIHSKKKSKRRKAEVSSGKVEQVELPCYPSPGNIEDEISSTYQSISQTSKPAKKEQEIHNLYKGWMHIANEVHTSKKDEHDLGLMDVDTFILQTHKILMANIMDSHITGPGQFSTNERHSDFEDVKHVYPHFIAETSAHAAATYIVDKYNDMIHEISNIPDSKGKEEKLKLSFKCASLFLFGFLALHPFGDGNGRLARLLCSYSLLTFSPFLTPIYNVFSSTVEEDYVNALVVARNDMNISPVIHSEEEAKKAADIVLRQKPSDLCALIIESNWSMWRKYLNILGIHKI